MILKKILLSALLALNLFAITIGDTPKEIIIAGENGGLVKDSASWESSTIKDKVFVLFYADPDEKDTNSHFSKKLKEKAYENENYGTIAIINLAATWLPDALIETLLTQKQKEFKNTVYVKDKKSVLVKEWDLEDDASNILLFSKESKLLFYKSGKMSDADINEVFKLIEENL